MLEEDKLEATNLLIKNKLLQLLPEQDKRQTLIQGLGISRREQANVTETCFYKPAVAVIIQGFKHSVVGSEKCDYGKNQFLLTGIDVPSSFYNTNASKEEPFLAVSLDLDKYLLSKLIAELPDDAENHDCCKALFVADIDPGTLDAFWRLLELLDRPERIPILAPMIIQEIHYRLLISPQGAFLRKLNTQGTQGNQITKAISWLKDNYKTPLHIDELAQSVNMASSTFYRHFKEITTISPLQFHKRLRLYEAKRLMIMENENAYSAGLSVGYESPTQFNREYKRLFGEAPYKNIKKLRE